MDTRFGKFFPKISRWSQLDIDAGYAYTQFFLVWCSFVRLSLFGCLWWRGGAFVDSPSKIIFIRRSGTGSVVDWNSRQLVVENCIVLFTNTMENSYPVCTGCRACGLAGCIAANLCEFSLPGAYHGAISCGEPAYVVSNHRESSQSRENARCFLPLIGMAAGFVSGLTGAVGLLFNRFYLHYGMSKEQIIATRAANELLLHIIKPGLYISFGVLSKRTIIIGCIIAVAAIFSSFSTKWLIAKLSETLFRLHCHDCFRNESFFRCSRQARCTKSGRP